MPGCFVPRDLEGIFVRLTQRLMAPSAVLRHARLYELGWRGLADLKNPIIAGLYYGVFAVLLTYLLVGFKVRAW